MRRLILTTATFLFLFGCARTELHGNDASSNQDTIDIQERHEERDRKPTL